MKDERRGFSGFNDMVSDLSDLPEAPPPTPLPPAKNASSLDDDDKPTPGLKKPSEPKSGAKIFFIVAGVLVAVIGLVYVSSQPKTPTYSPPPAKTSPPPWAQAPQVQQPSPAAPAPPFEQAPEPGQVAVVGVAQLRYCLSQSIRIDGAEKVIDTTSQNAIDRFNGLIADYNSRCGSIRYRKSDFESINPGIVLRRDALEKEGIALVRNPSKPSAGR
ncbi:MAG: hypothetical protein Q7R40_14465 [Phaeospirillum sp.]|nr:hypothetical protein [Phaeospirillum sp.]